MVEEKAFTHHFLLNQLESSRQMRFHFMPGFWFQFLLFPNKGIEVEYIYFYFLLINDGVDEILFYEKMVGERICTPPFSF